MHLLDEFRSAGTAQAYAAALARLVTRPWTIMEVCGGQTHAILRYGLDQLLPPEVTLIHGPGCPVCVTPVELIDAALAEFERRGAEALIHPGDVVAPFAAKRLLAWSKPLYITYGNNDGERRGLKGVLNQIQDGPLHVEIDGRRICVHHFVDWCSPEDVDRAEIIITGHTHEVINLKREGKLFLNPGECCGWVYGRCTIAMLNTDTMSAEIIELKP